VPGLALGFDPLLYLDIVEETPRPENIPPFRVGAYGLLDDHPLSAYQWGPPAEYFAARAESLLVQAPVGCEWFIRAEVLQIALDAGFNWIEFLHQQDCIVDAWTIDADQPGRIQLAQRLIEHGIDELTTNTPNALAQHLAVETIF
jgi:glycerophosphoryl diester phosphodiesterase